MPEAMQILQGRRLWTRILLGDGRRLCTSSDGCCHVPTALFHGDLFRASVSTAPVARGETGLGVVTLDPDSNSRQAP